MSDDAQEGGLRAHAPACARLPSFEPCLHVHCMAHYPKDDECPDEEPMASDFLWRDSFRRCSGYGDWYQA